MKPEKQEFVELKKIAVVGVSKTRPRAFGNYALKALRARGYQVFPVNAHADEVDGERCFRRLEDLPEPVEAVLSVVKPEQSVKIVEDCARLGIKRVWMQQGSESADAVKLCRDKGITEVHGACALMYLRPDGLHKFHRWISDLIGKQ
ncbi:MAG: CoA-binding protein [Deltaproteobacteria bacterium]|nr:CoA-binding protein [Deltaproteobacteria bacterium]